MLYLVHLNLLEINALGKRLHDDSFISLNGYNIIVISSKTHLLNIVCSNRDVKPPFYYIRTGLIPSTSNIDVKPPFNYIRTGLMWSTSNVDVSMMVVTMLSLQ